MRFQENQDILLRSITTVNVIYCFNGWGKEIKVQKGWKKEQSWRRFKTVKTWFLVLQQISALEARQPPALGAGGGDQRRLSLPSVAVHKMSFLVEDNLLLTSSTRERQTYKEQKEICSYAFSSDSISVQPRVSSAAVFASSGILFRGQEMPITGHTGKGVRRNERLEQDCDEGNSAKLDLRAGNMTFNIQNEE